jgi:hypothetical protein
MTIVKLDVVNGKVIIESTIDDIWLFTFFYEFFN